MFYIILYFIKDEQCLVLIVQFVQFLQESWCGCCYVVFVLNWFYYYCVGVVIYYCFYCLQIVEGNMDNICWFWVEIIGIFWLIVDGNGKQGVVMKGIMEGDDFGFIWVMVGYCIVMCQFKGCFIGFGVGVYKYYVFGEGSFDKFMFQMQCWFIGKDVVGVLQCFVLLMQCCYQCWMVMVKCCYCDIVGEIDIFFFLLILDVVVFFFYWDEFCWCINW